MPCYVKTCGDLARLYIFGKEHPQEREQLKIRVNRDTLKWNDFFFGIEQYHHFRHRLSMDKYVNAAICLKITRQVFSGVIDDFEYLECKAKKVKGISIYPIIRVSKKLKSLKIDFDKEYLVYGKFRLRKADEPKVGNKHHAVEFMTTLVDIKQIGEVSIT